MTIVAEKLSLSKSKLTTAHQCLKKLHLFVHRRDEGRVSAKALAAFKYGEAVGEEDSLPEYRQHFRCPNWEVVVPQFVLGLNGTGISTERSAAST